MDHWDFDLEAGGEKEQRNREGAGKLWLIKGQQQRGRGSGGSGDEPGAAAHPEVRDRAPEKINGVRHRKQSHDAGRARRIDAFVAQQIRERAADEAKAAKVKKPKGTPSIKANNTAPKAMPGQKP